MTDNPTPEQVEAAAAAYEEHGRHTRYYDNRVCTECDECFVGRAAFETHRWAASIAAAAGVTPQEPGAAKAIYISPSLPGMIRNLWKSDPSENSVRTALKLAGDLIQELIDIRAAPAQVGEAKIAEAMQEVESVHQIHGEACLCGFRSSRSRSRTEHITQALAEWLRGGGR